MPEISCHSNQESSKSSRKKLLSVQHSAIMAVVAVTSTQQIHSNATFRSQTYLRAPKICLVCATRPINEKRTPWFRTPSYWTNCEVAYFLAMLCVRVLRPVEWWRDLIRLLGCTWSATLCVVVRTVLICCHTQARYFNKRNDCLGLWTFLSIWFDFELDWV